jgi:hypothetical protein
LRRALSSTPPDKAKALRVPQCFSTTAALWAPFVARFDFAAPFP